MVTEYINTEEPYVSTLTGFKFNDADILSLQKLRCKLINKHGEANLYKVNRKKGTKKLKPQVIEEVRRFMKRIDRISAVEYDHINEVFRQIDSD